MNDFTSTCCCAYFLTNDNHVSSRRVRKAGPFEPPQTRLSKASELHQPASAQTFRTEKAIYLSLSDCTSCVCCPGDPRARLQRRNACRHASIRPYGHLSREEYHEDCLVVEVRQNFSSPRPLSRSVFSRPPLSRPRPSWPYPSPPPDAGSSSPLSASSTWPCSPPAPSISPP